MPSVKKGESRSDYLGRAIPIIKRENPGISNKAAVGKAEGMYNSKWGLKKSGK